MAGAASDTDCVDVADVLDIGCVPSFATTSVDDGDVFGGQVDGKDGRVADVDDGQVDGEAEDAASDANDVAVAVTNDVLQTSAWTQMLQSPS